MKSILMAVVLFAATSCCSNFDLEGSSWSMVTMNGEALSEDVAVDADSFTILFGADNALGGKGVCNRLIGRYSQLEAGEISIEGVGATLMFCPNLELESEFIDALESATRYAVKGGTLTIYSGDEAVLTFEQEAE